ncbi:MAG: hypothetical protein ACI8TF_000463 [Paracoccaceae bacterium]|jgi:hypothetical protein
MLVFDHKFVYLHTEEMGTDWGASISLRHPALRHPTTSYLTVFVIFLFYDWLNITISALQLKRFGATQL